MPLFQLSCSSLQSPTQRLINPKYSSFFFFSICAIREKCLTFVFYFAEGGRCNRLQISKKSTPLFQYRSYTTTIVIRDACLIISAQRGGASFISHFFTNMAMIDGEHLKRQQSNQFVKKILIFPNLSDNKLRKIGTQSKQRFFVDFYFTDFLTDKASRFNNFAHLRTSFQLDRFDSIYTANCDIYKDKHSVMGQRFGTPKSVNFNFSIKPSLFLFGG